MNRRDRQHELPLNILQETYRPLAFFAGEMMIAASPFLPEIVQSWAKRLLAMDERNDTKTDSHRRASED